MKFLSLTGSAHSIARDHGRHLHMRITQRLHMRITPRSVVQSKQSGFTVKTCWLFGMYSVCCFFHFLRQEFKLWFLLNLNPKN